MKTAKEQFLLTPLREGRPVRRRRLPGREGPISTHAPAGGATAVALIQRELQTRFLLTPLREGRRARRRRLCAEPPRISTHAPAGGATTPPGITVPDSVKFLLTPLREGRPAANAEETNSKFEFLLTPLREGRHNFGTKVRLYLFISTHAPAGGATSRPMAVSLIWPLFLLTPLREGRLVF